MVAGTTNQTVIATAVGATQANLADEVSEGSVIKAVFIEMWFRGGETSPGSVLATLVRVPDQQQFTFTDATDLNSYNNKKNIMYHTQGLTNVAGDTAIPLIRQWFKIPKGKQRMGLGDRLILGISAQALDTNVCGFMTYKEYT